MQIKTGTDIIEIDRIKTAIEKFGNTFLNSIFTEKEIEYCEKHKKQKYQHYAGKFAAKEAVFKSISFYYKECKWKEYEILNDENGRPYVNLKCEIPNLQSIDISISHCRTFAIAVSTILI